MTSTPPSGTVTFLFTDIEGSSQLWERQPEAMQAALAQHDAILRSTIQSNQGHLVKTTGDGVHASFSKAMDAVNATLDAQHQFQSPLGELQLKVRMGVYTGEAELRSGDYYGKAINRAARLMAAANGGQILLSNTTAELLRDQLPEYASLRDLGEHRLKDLSQSEHIFQLLYPGLPDVFPPIRSIDSFPNNLPIQLTSFVGREKEKGEIKELLNTARLVTLTGSGGTGKTRLGLEVGAQALESFANGVWLIELAPLTDPAQVIPAIAQTFGLQERSFTPLAGLVTDYLRDKNLLLLLDNCEHLIEICARLADDLLRHCARIKILASSREALGIAGEVSYRVPSLAETEAARLFVERAQAANPRFHLTEAYAPAIAKICTRLDGIPLAIELAAARSKLLAPEQIAAHLDDRFRLLVGGSRTALPRQQTLRALIDWSYNLLSAAEQRLLRTASVFAGGWTLDAIEAVSEDPNTLALLDQLVNRSLVVAEEHDGQMRYSLLETIRQYAREKLLDAGSNETISVRNRHLDFYVKMAEAAEPRLIGSDMIKCMDELEQEQDNLRAAVGWAIENDPLSALRMAKILNVFWGRRLSATEGFTWVTAALKRAEESISLEDKMARHYMTARASALTGQAAMAFQIGDNVSARDAVQTAVSLARQINAPWILASGLGLGSIIAGFLGDIAMAQEWGQEALTLSRKHGFAYIRAMYSGTSMFMAVLNNRPVPQDELAEVLHISRTTSNPWILAMTLTNAGRVMTMSGHWIEAQQYLEESAALCHQLRDRSMYTSSRSEIGHILRQQGNYSGATAIYRETIKAFQEMGYGAAVAHQLECFGFIAARQEHLQRAATLLGAAEALRDRLASSMTPIERREYELVVSGLRAQMGEAALARAWAEGRTLSMEQAIQLAIDS